MTAVPSLLLVAILTNGPMVYTDALKHQIQQCNWVIAVDGGLRHCEAMGIVPNLMVGDFDSVSRELMAKYPNVPLVVLDRAKDSTDLETALRTLDMTQVDKIYLYGGAGGRQDHVLGHYYFLLRYPGKLILQTGDETVFAVTPQLGTVVVPSVKGQTISLMPFYGPVHNVVTEGLKWELPGSTLHKDFLGISNVCLGDQFTIRVGEGALLCMINRSLIDLEMIDLEDHTSTKSLQNNP
jgi:thiamine pyrophosphokinase